MTKLRAVHPVLMSRNVAASGRFYETLGFSLVFQNLTENPTYAVVTKDSVELHLQWQDESQWAAAIDRPTYRFLVEDVDSFYEYLYKRGVFNNQASSDSPWLTPGNTAWGTREFHLLDPDGIGLQFYRPK